MKRPMLTGILVLAALAAVTPPLEAGESFIPIARDQPNGGASTHTIVFVSNTATTAKSYTTTFLVAGTDGVAHPGTTTTLSINGGQTVRLETSVPASSTGMLRIDGPSDLVIDARVEVTNGGGLISEARVPVLSPERVTQAGKTLYLQGLSRTATGKPVTDFGVANLTRDAASCTISAVRSNGQAIGSAATFSLFPLSLRDFPEVWVTLGVPEIADARITVTCNKQFTAFALVYDVGGPRTTAVTPGGLLDGTLEPITRPGEVQFNVPGDFLIARSGDSFRTYNIPLVPNLKYEKATIDFDMFLNKFPPGLFTGVTSMRRGNRDRHQRILYYGIQIRNDNKKTNLDLGDEVLIRSAGGVWKKTTQYHMHFEYDLTINRVTLTVTQDGRQTLSISGPPQTHELVDNGNAISVDFGQTGIADGAYFPPIGWVYSNLQVKFEPEN